MTQTELTTAIASHLDALHNLASWLARDAADTQALVQTTCRQALRTIPQQPLGTNVRIGLFTLLWEIHRQHRGLSSDSIDHGAGGPVMPVRRMLFRTLSRTDLDAGLRQLPDMLRAALILADVEGYPLEEVAEVFGWSMPQTHTALAQARQLLEGFLQARLAATAVSPTSKEKDSL